MFSRIVTSALLAGFCAGLLAALLQLMFLQPVLLHAELFETGKLVHFGGQLADAHPDLPGFDLMRDGLSALFWTLLQVGYALILVACMAFAAERGVVIDARRGLLWGLAGFIAVQFAPAFSLPPEVPGAAYVDLTARQVWWWGTAIATAVAMALIAFGTGAGMWGAAVVLLLAPHLIGAPQPEAFAGSVPPELASMFAARALGVGLASWALTGLLGGYFWQRENAGS
ncbi:putative cobalt transporter subunit (CbtA) [Roseovarius litorisediminis]|uniref:Putative cobalt transporter subunit (CbtA) n=1 Tax=Roseovarius litorisediminis TaxID=1312363 RepID=A0A1Y5TAN5_9RHOB|nr:CbtA family protein [Roseovarius litorisediminis]SLN59745.1 putative cobalt transporter subunit (CbtA) [Roseovarius litorisediminis]